MSTSTPGERFRKLNSNESPNMAREAASQVGDSDPGTRALALDWQTRPVVISPEEVGRPAGSERRNSNPSSPCSFRYAALDGASTIMAAE